MAIQQWTPKPLRTTPVVSLEEFRAQAYTCTAGFGSVDDADRMDLRKVRLSKRHPLADGALSRLGWWDQQVVGHVGVIRMKVRLGEALLEFAGIAGVCADPRARNQGIASVLMRQVLDASKRDGLCFSVLFGIRSFYHRFGFVPAWAKHTVTAKIEDLPAGPRWRARKVRQADFPKMLEYYRKQYGGSDGAAEREPRLFPRRTVGFILQGPRKADWAYALFRMISWEEQNNLQLVEACGGGPDWPDAVLHEASRYAAKVKKESMVFNLPAAHPICRRLTFCNATGKIEYVRNGAAMACVLDFAGLARTMGPEWCRRIGEAGVTVPREGLAIRFRDEYYRWRPDRADGWTERLDRVPRKFDMEFGDALARLVMGYGEPEEILHHYGMRTREAALPIVRAIFPARTNAFSPVDHF